MSDVIDKFDGEFAFLSNFFPSPISVCLSMPDGTTQCVQAATVEHAFQASKAKTVEDALFILNQTTPGRAKRAGKKIALADGWDENRLTIMHSWVERKFAQDGLLRRLLLNTGNAQLIEDNNWGDRWWGICDGVGENHLGKILMDVRNLMRTSYDLV